MVTLGDGYRFTTWAHILTPPWRAKIGATRSRDRRNRRRLQRAGWRVTRIWQHELEADFEGCVRRIVATVSLRLTQVANYIDAQRSGRPRERRFGLMSYVPARDRCRDLRKGSRHAGAGSVSTIGTSRSSSIPSRRTPCSLSPSAPLMLYSPLYSPLTPNPRRQACPTYELCSNPALREPTPSSASSAAAAWPRSTWPATSGTTGRSPSRSCIPSSPPRLGPERFLREIRARRPALSHPHILPAARLRRAPTASSGT